MKRILVSLTAITLALSPIAASAHERQVFEIGHDVYEFTIGSLNEPIVVDDKTGLELSVRKIEEHSAEAEEDHHSTQGAVSGLEQTLKVELIAGSIKKVMDISPVYNTPGAYKNTFYPTVATTLSYRIFGTIDGAPIDFTATCTPVGHARAEEDKTEVEISEGVTRTLKTGGFGCPMAKEDLGFPEKSVPVISLSEGNASSSTRGNVGIIISVVALLVAGYAVSRKVS